MQTLPEFTFDLTEFCPHTRPYRLPQHDEPPVPGSVARVREAKKVEGFRLSLATSPAILGGVPPEFNQASFVGMQFQSELVETLPQVPLKPLGILTVLKANCKVVRKAHDEPVRVSGASDDESTSGVPFFP